MPAHPKPARFLRLGLLCLLPLLWALPFLHASTAPAAETLINPLIRQRADPHVYLHTDGWYYLTATVPEYDRIELRRARSVAALATAEVSTIWTKHATGEMGAHIWAPEIHFIDGRWFIYFTAGKAEAKWEIRLYVLENSSANPLEGTWLERGQLRTNWESFTLDATTFSHRGRRYLVWTQRQDDIKGTNIYIARMDSPTSITGRQVLLTRPDLPWEQQRHWVTEAPSVLVREDRVWLSYSASATDANYCLGLLSARSDADLLDAASWTKSPVPVLSSSERNGQYGPGHNCFTTTPDGSQVLLVYHARNYKEIQGEPLRDPNRHTRVQHLRFRDDGSPDFGEPVPDGPLAP